MRTIQPSKQELDATHDRLMDEYIRLGITPPNPRLYDTSYWYFFGACLGACLTLCLKGHDGGKLAFLARYWYLVLFGLSGPLLIAFARKIETVVRGYFARRRYLKVELQETPPGVRKLPSGGGPREAA